MNQEDLRDLLRVRPFQPFRLHMTDEIAYEVRHPDMMIVTRRTAIVAVGGQQDLGLPERAILISLLHIVRVEPLEADSGQG